MTYIREPPYPYSTAEALEDLLGLTEPSRPDALPPAAAAIWAPVMSTVASFLDDAEVSRWTRRIGALQQPVEGKQVTRLPWPFLPVHLLEPHNVRAHPEDLWAHQGDPLVQRRPLAGGRLVEILMLNVAIRTLVTAAPPLRPRQASPKRQREPPVYSRSAVDLLPTAIVLRPAWRRLHRRQIRQASLA